MSVNLSVDSFCRTAIVCGLSKTCPELPNSIKSSARRVAKSCGDLRISGFSKHSSKRLNSYKCCDLCHSSACFSIFLINPSLPSTYMNYRLVNSLAFFKTNWSTVSSVETISMLPSMPARSVHRELRDFACPKRWVLGWIVTS